jgi:broad specificity phosphatase PhoE
VSADLGRPLTLHLIRHARTADTGLWPSGGDVDGPPLSELGVAEAIALAAALAGTFLAADPLAADQAGVRGLSPALAEDSGSSLVAGTAEAVTIPDAITGGGGEADGWASGSGVAGDRGAADASGHVTGPGATVGLGAVERSAPGGGSHPVAGLGAATDADPAVETMVATEFDSADAQGSVASSGALSGPSAALGPDSAQPDLLLLASPLLRTLQTAQIIGSALGLEAELAPEWAELRLGEWDGLTYRQIARGWPDEYARWQASPAAQPPGGESVDDLRARVEAALHWLRMAQAGKSVVLITHTGPIRAAVASALDAGPAAFWRLRIDPASVTTLRFWADGGVEVVGVNRWVGADGFTS